MPPEGHRISPALSVGKVTRCRTQSEQQRSNRLYKIPSSCLWPYRHGSTLVSTRPNKKIFKANSVIYHQNRRDSERLRPCSSKHFESVSSTKPAATLQRPDDQTKLSRSISKRDIQPSFRLNPSRAERYSEFNSKRYNKPSRPNKIPKLVYLTHSCSDRFLTMDWSTKGFLQLRDSILILKNCHNCSTKVIRILIKCL